MFGDELLLLLLAVDHHDGVDVQVAVLSCPATAFVLLEQYRVTNLESPRPLVEDCWSMSVDRLEHPNIVHVEQLHLGDAGQLHVAVQCGDDRAHPRIEVGLVGPEWDRSAGNTWTQVFLRPRCPPGGPVVSAEGSGTGQWW